MKRLWILFTSSFKLSAFTFGGGYVIVPLLRNRFVEDLGWIEDKEMMDLVAIAQSSPGSLAVNASILVGYKIAKVPGVIIATLATVIPPLVILSIISYFYVAFKENIYIQAGLGAMAAAVAAVVVDVVIKMYQSVRKEKNPDSLYIMLFVFILGAVFKINIVILILFVIVYGSIKYIRKSRS